MANPWALLLQDGIIERRRTILRLTARFLAHAEGTAGRRRLMYDDPDLQRALYDALGTWGYEGDAWEASARLALLVSERDQWGGLQRWVRPAGTIVLG